MKKYIGGGFLALGLLFSVSFTAQAAGLTEAQITAVVNLLASFGADQTTINNVNASLRGQSTTAINPTNVPGHEASSCVTLTRQLTINSIDAITGGEVSKLQTYLMGQGTVSDPIYPERLVTGTFGPATSRAVQKWQTAHNITITTPGVGVVGPKTRIAMACGGGY